MTKKATPSLVPLEVFQRRQRGRRRLVWLAGISLVLTLAWLDHAGLLLYQGSDLARYDGQSFEVVRVIDGDTLDVARENHPITRVRLWGVDTPELAKPRRNQPDQPWAQQAKAFTLALTQGQRVTLHLESHRTRGVFGRLLAHVELFDGTLLGAQLLTHGWASVDKRWSHDHVAYFDQLQQQAKQNKVGQWSQP